MPAVDALKYTLSHFDNADIWFEASYDLNTKTGWLGRWIDRNGIANNPLQAISIDTALSKSIRTVDEPGVRDQRAAVDGLHAERRQRQPTGGAQRHDRPQRGDQHARGRRGRRRATPTSGARARPTGSHTRRTTQVKSRRACPATRERRLPEQRHALHAPADRRAPAQGANLGTRVITIHWGGFDTHTNQLRARTPAEGALARARRLPGRPRSARGIDAARGDARVLGVRPPREGDAEHDGRRATTPAPTTARAA